MAFFSIININSHAFMQQMQKKPVSTTLKHAWETENIKNTFKLNFK